jgi:hypothetical protein
MKPYQYGINNKQENQGENKTFSILDPSILEYKEFIQSLYTNDISYIENNLNKEINTENLAYFLDFTKFSDDLLLNILNKDNFNFDTPKNCLEKIYLYENQQELLEKLVRLINRQDLNKFYVADNYLKYIYKNMTTNQIEKFLSLLPQSFNKDIIYNELINRNYTIHLEKAKSLKDHLLTRKILIQIYEYLKDKPLTFNSMRSDNLLLILENGVKVNIYEKKYFLEYLENPIFSNYHQYNFSNEKFAIITQCASNLNRQTMCNIENKSIEEENKIINKYLRYFFLFENSKPDDFSQFLHLNFIMREYYNALVLKGDENHTNEIINYLSNSVYEELVKKTQITICEHNKEKFLLDEKISLDVDIKNISTLFVKIFEINTENYYYNKKEALNSAISLEGLIATYEETYSFAEKPQKLIRRTFDFEKIPNKRGIYIIEFIGNGYSSRAIIKKGGLSLVHRSTVNGKILFLLDENQKICKGTSTGVWINDTFYKSSDKTGSILIPYMRSSSSSTAIVVHDNFAEIATVNLETENYSLDGTLILNRESIIMGNNAKLLVTPYLFINNRIADVKNLTSPKVKIDLVKIENDQQIPINLIFEGEQLLGKGKASLSKEREIEIDFQVPPRLISIKVTFQAVVKNKSKNTNETLSITKDLSCHMNSSLYNRYAHVFLRKIKGDYIIEILGKNGEPKYDVELEVSLSHKIKKVKKNILTSNKEGQINLGKLNGVYTIYLKGNYRGENLAGFFVINNDNLISYPSQLDIIEGEVLKFPINNDPEVMDTFSFVKLSDNESTVLENLTENVKVSQYNESSNHRYISVGDLSEGNYLLNWNFNNKNIFIKVHRGEYWEDGNFIITESGMIENSEYKNPVHLENFSVSQSENNKKSINLKVNTDAINPRVHLFAYKFMSEFDSYCGYLLQQNMGKTKYKNTYTFIQNKNIYLSNRLLNEEIQYVLDRKQYERFMGNSLDKPSLLLKRHFIRDTTTLIKEAKEGTNYQKVQLEKLQEKEISPEKSKKKLGKKMDSYRGGPEMYDLIGFSGATSQLIGIYPKNDLNEILRASGDIFSKIINFPNFLQYSPLIISNLIPDHNGEIKIDVSGLEKYSTLHALVIDDKSVYEENLYLDYETQISKRDLTMNNPLENEKYYAELRKTFKLLTGSQFVIKDITSTNFKIIDSLEKLISYYSLTSEFSSVKSYWEKFSFLIKFDELSETEKMKNISEFFSHELNLFLFFKHNDFFNQSIKPILKFKAEKTFIDFFLLNDMEKILTFTTPERLNDLNSLEKCLLIYSIRKTNGSLAVTIAKNMRSQSDQNKISEQEMKRLFNVIINMRTEEENNEKPQSPFAAVADELPSFSHAQPTVAPGLFGCSAQPRSSNMRAMAMPQMLKCAVIQPQMMMEQRRNVFEEAEDDEAEELYNQINIANNLTKEPGKSKEYCEKHYYIEKVGPSSRLSVYRYLTPVNAFYADLAEFWANSLDTDLSKNFISSNIILPVSNITQLISVLSIIDLPSKSISHNTSMIEGRGLQIIPNSNMIIFTKEISETQSDVKSALMIAQVVNKKGADEIQSLEENEENLSSSSNNNYVINEIYNHETIVTNISNKTLNFELLIQIPEGSIPVDGSDYTKTINLKLSKFMTQKFDTFFYFPKESEQYVHYPASASINGVVVSKASPLFYKVETSIKKLNLTSLQDVLESGSKEEILDYFSKSDKVKSTDFSKVYYLLKDKDFYSKFLNILKIRGLYDDTVWRFSLLHKDENIIREFLNSNNEFRKIVGPYADFSLLKIDESNNFDIAFHRDYHPILNARVHKIGSDRNSQILNVEFKETYQQFISYLIGLKKIDDKNYLRLCYYLILQDRIEEALDIFEMIKLDENSDEFSSLRLQYDYISAYLDFTVGYPEFKKAKEVCQVYKNFPLNHWRELFEEIEDQLLEYQGKATFDDIDMIMDEERKKKQTSKFVAEKEPKLSFTIENKSLQIIYSNLSSINIKFYLIDLEILFSRTPFIKQNSDDFSFVQPNFIKNLNLENLTKETIMSFPIPEEYVNSNLFIEVSSTNKKSFDTYFSTSLVINISETLGEVKVMSKDLLPLTKTYVKCFAKYKDESVKFYKDGYTDLRGKFNYVSLNTTGLKDVKKFSLFIAHDTLGSTIKESNPPTNLSQESSEGLNEYDMYQNYRQQVKNVWKSMQK